MRIILEIIIIMQTLLNEIIINQFDLCIMWLKHSNYFKRMMSLVSSSRKISSHKNNIYETK